MLDARRAVPFRIQPWMRVRLAAVASAAIVALMAVVAGGGCSRPDPTTSALSAQQQQEISLLREQLRQMKESSVAATATPTGNPFGPTHADLRDIEAKLARLDARQIPPDELQKLKLLAESADRDAKRVSADMARLQTKYESLLAETAQRDAKITQLQTVRDELLAKIVDQESRVAEIQTQVEARWNEMADRLSKLTAPAQANAALDAEIHRLTELLQTRAAETAVLTAQLTAADEEVKKLRKRVLDQSVEIKNLQDQLAGRVPAPAANQPPTTPGATAVPETVREGAVTGEILGVQVDPTMISAIVKFPPSVEFREGARYNIFNDAGEKIADFRVTSRVTPQDVAGQEVWLGGIVTPLKREVLPRATDPRTNAPGDRVTNMASLPARSR